MIGVLSAPTDYTWDIVEQFHWSYLEVNLGIVCVSVPALQPFVKQYLGPVFSSQLRSSKREDSKKQQQAEPYSTAVGRNAERREAKMQGYELESRDDGSEDSPFKPGIAVSEDELRLWRREDGQHATLITSDATDGANSLSESRAPVAHRLEAANPRGISVKKETSIKFNKS